MSDQSFERLHDQMSADPERPLTLMNRRRFLQGAIVAGGALAVPTAFADYAAAQGGSDTVVLTVTLRGGNDGLNTLGPFNKGAYKDVRGRLAIGAKHAHAAKGSLFFHPNLGRLASRFKAGDVAVVRGVGDPLRDQSHFSNLARWQSANPDGRITGTGWLGRYLDQSNTTAFSGVAVGGSGVPLHMRSQSSDVTDLPRIGGSRLFGAESVEGRDVRMYSAIRNMGQGSNRSEWVNRVAQVNALSVSSARDAAPAFERDLPESNLALDMVLAARVVNLNLGTRVLDVSQRGFDLHDDQVGTSPRIGAHADLLQELDAGIDLFFRTLGSSMRSRAVVVVYSEFGRRVEPNGSNGTDHGTANHMFVIGDRVAGGYYGSQPSLRDLDDRGNLRVTTDFRRAYASVLEGALNTSGSRILGGRYSTMDLFS